VAKRLKNHKNPNLNQIGKKILLNSFAKNTEIKRHIGYQKRKKKMSARDIDKKIETLEMEIKLGKLKLADVEQQLNNLKLQAFEEDIREQDNRSLLQE
jgi:hypothetical protein